LLQEPIAQAFVGSNPTLCTSTQPRKVKILKAERKYSIGGCILATDVQRVKKPKLPKKRFLKKTMNRKKR
jgi:hypothetical protein